MIMLLDLSFFNLYIQFNACHEALDEIQEKMDTCKFIINVQQELKYALRSSVCVGTKKRSVL